MSLPVRTTLRPAPLHVQQSPEYLSLLRSLTLDTGPALVQSLEHAAEHPCEVIQLLAVGRFDQERAKEHGGSRGGEGAAYLTARDAAHRLQERALAQADEEGVLWTPLLDELLRTGKDYFTGEWRETVLAERQARGVAPDVRSQANRLPGLIRTIRDPQAIDTLLASFRSRGVRGHIAQHARCLNRAHYEMLLGAHSEMLASNTHLPEELKHDLAERAIRGWLDPELSTDPKNTRGAATRGRPGAKPSAGSTNAPGAESEIDREGPPALHPESAPRSALHALLLRSPLVVTHVMGERIYAAAQATRNKDTADERISLLVEFKDARLEWLECAARIGQEFTLERVLGHDRATDECIRIILSERGKAGIGAARSILSQRSRQPRLSADRIWMILRGLPFEQAETVIFALRLPNATPEMQQWAIERYPDAGPDYAWQNLWDEFADSLRGRTDPEFRRTLLNKVRPGKLVEMLPALGADEYVQILTRLVKRDELEAARALRERPVPDGVRLPDALLERMLTSEEGELRLAAIAAAGQLGIGRATPSEQEPSVAAAPYAAAPNAAAPSDAAPNAAPPVAATTGPPVARRRP
jgi:hypothetical protein